MRGKFISGYLMDDTQTQAWIIFLIVNVIFRSCYSQSVLAFRPNRVVVKVNSTDKQTLFTHLKTYGFTYVHKITPSIFTFDYDYDNNNRTLRESLLIIKDVFTDELLETEPVRLYTNMIQPWDRGKETHLPIVEYIPPESSIQDGNGVGVSAVWSRGYSGRGVTVAVTGVGIDPYLLDLQKNLKLDLSFNYMYNKYDITPEYFSRSQSKALLLTDQGNNIAGLIAAEKDNGLCGAGIAYGSSIVGLTIFKVGPLRDNLSTLKLLTISDVIARALTHRLDDIDVFINAWIPSSSFDQLDLATRDAIVYGATAGRRGLGSVYVVPAGPAGNVLSNNIYTITVGVLDVNGTKQRNTLSDASVLTSGLISSKMVTTSDNNRCIANFKGYSAAESQIGAIITLGIEANPRLSLREIQHLLVLASEHSWLRTSSLFKRNGAGHYFSEMFGFGVLNAEKFVTLSKNVTVNPLIRKSLKTTVITPTSALEKNVTFCYSCDIISDVTCLTTVEHVAITLSTDVPVNNITVELLSPCGTQSVLIDNQHIEQPVKEAQLISTNFWDELAFGAWVLVLRSKNLNSTLNVKLISLTLYGTRNKTVSDAVNLPLKHICKYDTADNDITASTVESSTGTIPDSKSDSDDKLNIPLIVALPVGIVIMCFMLLFICKRGGTQGPVSVYGKPKKNQQKQEKKGVFNRQISQDNRLHRQVSLLREHSRQSGDSDELAEDIEGEEAAAEALNDVISEENDLHRQVSLLRQKSKLASPSKVLIEDVEAEEAAMNNNIV